jgi:hypothetical protein
MRTLPLHLALLLSCTTACLPDQPCDPDQKYSYGGCFPLGLDASITGDSALEGGLDVARSCRSFCTFSKECVADNPTASSLLGGQLMELGLQGDDLSGCEARCNAAAGTASSATALQCFEARSAQSTCAQKLDLSGATESIAIFNECCAGVAADGVCKSLCDALSSSAIGTFLTFCP